MHWFNPVVHLFAKSINILCETSCDVEVLQSADATERKAYGEAIINASQAVSKSVQTTRPQTALSTSFNGGKNGMLKRILSIADTRKKKTGVIITCVILLSALTIGGVFAFQSDPSAPEEYYSADANEFIWSDVANSLEHAISIATPGNYPRAYGGVGDFRLADTPYGRAIRLEEHDMSNFLAQGSYEIHLTLRMRNAPQSHNITLLINDENPQEGILESYDCTWSSDISYKVIFEAYSATPISRIDFIYDDTRNIVGSGMRIEIFPPGRPPWVRTYSECGTYVLPLDIFSSPPPLGENEWSRDYEISGYDFVNWIRSINPGSGYQTSWDDRMTTFEIAPYNWHMQGNMLAIPNEFIQRESITIPEIQRFEALPVARLVMGGDNVYTIVVTPENDIGGGIFTGLRDYYVESTTLNGSWRHSFMNGSREAGTPYITTKPLNFYHHNPATSSTDIEFTPVLGSEGIFYLYVASATHLLTNVYVEILANGTSAEIEVLR